MSIFVESVDVDAAWEVYYQLAQRRWKKGLTREQLAEVIEAALVGVVEAEEDWALDSTREPSGEGWREIADTGLFVRRSASRRFVAPWVEGEEHQ